MLRCQTHISRCCAGILWAAKRCRAAQMLRCDLETVCDLCLEELRPILAACHHPGLPNLRELHLLCQADGFSESVPEGISRDEWMRPCAASAAETPLSNELLRTSTVFFEIMLQCAAAWAPGVQLLRGEVWDLVSGRRFPILPNLRHLVLSVMEGQGLSDLLIALPLMSHLETLHLTTSPKVDSIWTPAMDLAPCTKLQSVWLGGIVPAELALGDSCKLYLDLYDLVLAHAPIWATLSSVHNLYLGNWPGGEIQLKKIPLLSGAVQLDVVYISSFTTGRDLPLGISAAHELHISGVYIKLCIPAVSKWKLLEVFASGSLELEFEDLNNFANGPPAFALNITGPKGSGVWDLVAALHMCEQWVYVTECSARLHLCNRCDPENMACCSMDIAYEPYQRYMCSSIYCRCGACARCLIAAAKMTSTG